MRKVFRWWPPVIAAGVLVFVVGARFWADEPADKNNKSNAPQNNKAFDQKVYDLTRTIINRGADIANRDRDFNGCYRYYQGCLMTLRALLDQHTDLQKSIDTALAQAERAGSVLERGRILNRALFRIRARTAPRAAAREKTQDKGPVDRKPLRDRKPVDRRPRDLPRDVKKDEPKDADKDRPADKPVKDKPVKDEGENRPTKDKPVKDAPRDKPADKPVKDEARDKKDDKPVKDEAKDKADDKPAKDEARDKPAKDEARDKKDDKPVKDESKVKAKDKDIPKDLLKDVKKEDKPVADKKGEEKKGEEEKGEEKKVEGPAKVTGKVTFQGKPLTAGTIAFTAVDGKSVSGPIQADGTYTVAKLFPLPYKITVTNTKPVVPPVYADVKKTALRYIPQKGTNSLDLQLK